MSHVRVIPRDFFNESKLLKCLGHLELVVNHTGPNEIGLRSEFDNEPFKIVQNTSDATLSVSNYKLFLGDEEIELFIPYNSRENFPLIGKHKGSEYYMFDETGKIMPNFGVIK